MIFCKTFHFDDWTLLGLDSLSGSTFHIFSMVLVFEFWFWIFEWKFNWICDINIKFGTFFWLGQPLTIIIVYVAFQFFKILQTCNAQNNSLLYYKYWPTYLVRTLIFKLNFHGKFLTYFFYRIYLQQTLQLKEHNK